MNSQFIYKICQKTEWEQARETGVYTGSTVDKEDGFIHFSPIDLLKSTAEKYFKNQDAVILEVNTKSLNHIKWEEARGGSLFPHLYGNLNVRQVVRIYDLKLDLDDLCRNALNK